MFCLLRKPNGLPCVLTDTQKPPGLAGKQWQHESRTHPSSALAVRGEHLHFAYANTDTILTSYRKVQFSGTKQMSPPAIPALGMPSSTTYASAFSLLIFLLRHETHSHPVHTTHLQPTLTFCCFRAAYGISLF